MDTLSVRVLCWDNFLTHAFQTACGSLRGCLDPVYPDPVWTLSVWTLSVWTLSAIFLMSIIVCFDPCV